MWSVIKIDRKKINFFKKEFKKKLGGNCEFYTPRLDIESFKNNKKISKQINLLGDYIFCFNQNFENKDLIRHLKNTKGLKYFLNGFSNAQNEISQFIEKCKSLENSEGLIKKNVFSIFENRKYKFLSGPLSGTLLKVLEQNKGKLSVLVGNIKVQVNKKNYLFEPVQLIKFMSQL